MVSVPNHLLHNDLFTHTYGMEHCYQNYVYGPTVKEHFILYYAIEGEGTLKIGQDMYAIPKGQGFLIRPKTEYQLIVNENNSWSYCWVGFYGIQAENIINTTNLVVNSPVFNYDLHSKCFRQFLHFINDEVHHSVITTSLQLQGILYFLLATLVKTNPNQNMANRQIRKEEYVGKVIDYIDVNYSKKITVAQIAEFVGLDRSYLSSLFKEYLNLSVQEYLIQFRLNKACSILLDNDWPIGMIAKSVGYEDPLLFSKIFKKYKGMSPKYYRNQVEHHNFRSAP